VLTNVRKHSQAHTATVVVESSGEGYLVRVADDGVGFSVEDIAAVPGHLGLAGIRERAELSGGWLRITSGQGLGTAVEFWIPAFAGTEDANGAGSTNGSDGGTA
jgi:two-component system, sensor histidine kinase